MKAAAVKAVPFWRLRPETAGVDSIFGDNLFCILLLFSKRYEELSQNVMSRGYGIFSYVLPLTEYFFL